MLTFLILHVGRINVVRLQNLYLALCKQPLIRAIVHDNNIFLAPRMEQHDEYQ